MTDVIVLNLIALFESMNNVTKILYDISLPRRRKRLKFLRLYVWNLMTFCRN